MNCADTHEMLADYLGDELSSENRRKVDDHLSACGPCRDEVQSLLRAVDSMRLLDAPTEFATHAAGHGDMMIGESTQQWRRMSIWGHGLAYAAVLLAGLAIGWNAKPGSIGDGPQTQESLATPMPADGDRTQPVGDSPLNKARESESRRSNPLLRNALALSQAFTQHRSR